MPILSNVLLCIVFVLLSAAGIVPDSSARAPEPHYANDGQLQLPERYRQWTYLTSGFDMSYSAGMQMGDHMFDNVFVNPNSYAAFEQTGTWPDKTMLVLEHRVAQSKGSINKAGDFQTDVMDVEVHVKDTARFPGRWAFYSFGAGAKTGTMLPTAAACYACHSSHAAVDTTFVQFYPTLLPIAKTKGTLDSGYLHDVQGTQP